jgi:hypothetical protein
VINLVKSRWASRCVAVVACWMLLCAGISKAEKRPFNKTPIPTKAPDWRLSLYPNGHTFAFTIVHDADSSYSHRLAPLFDEFDALDMKITATIFVFWADWAKDGKIWSSWNQIDDPEKKLFAPVAVPLVDDNERAFYLGIAARGHEIGMHTPSDTSDTTQRLQNAFEYFTRTFGHPPTIYVEHSTASNKETLQNEGANPRSNYYSLAVLKSYHPWVWVDGPWGLPADNEPRYYDLVASNGAPFSNKESQHYGLDKVFMRTGKWHKADGDGFLDEYSVANVDDLERNRGVALVYTHLDSKWLDPSTHKMRAPICERLRYITSKNGWFAPAGTILDRVTAMQQVSLDTHGRYVTIRNRGAQTIDAVTVISPAGASLCKRNAALRPALRGDIVVGNIKAHESVTFRACHAKQ